MAEVDLPVDVKGFIVENISSIGALEVFLLLVKNSERAWTAAEVGRELRTNEASAGNHLTELVSRGLLRQAAENENSYLYAPESEQLSSVVKKLVSYHATHYHRLIHLIYNKPIERLKEFANAFKFRKDPEDG